MHVGPVPERMHGQPGIVEQQAPLDVLVGIERVVTDVAHARLLWGPGVQIEMLTVEPSLERHELGLGALVRLFRQIGVLIPELFDRRCRQSQGGAMQACQPAGQLTGQVIAG